MFSSTSRRLRARSFIPSLSIESAQEARLTSSAMLALRAASSRQLVLSRPSLCPLTFALYDYDVENYVLEHFETFARAIDPHLLKNPTSGKACGGERRAVGDTDATDLVAVGQWADLVDVPMVCR
jgi:hypothetical protein